MSTEHLPAPRPPAEELISSVEVVVVLKTTVHLIDCAVGDLATKAEQVAAEEIDEFADAFGWEQVSLSCTPVIVSVSS